MHARENRITRAAARVAAEQQQVDRLTADLNGEADPKRRAVLERRLAGKHQRLVKAREQLAHAERP